MSLLEMSISGAVFIIAIVMIRVAAINRLPKKTFLVLWMLALVRLLVPFSIPSMFSVYTLISSNGATPTFSVTDADNIIQDTPHQNPIGAMQGSGSLQQGAQASVSLLFIVWCAGMAAFAIFFAVSYLRCLREFQTALPVHDPYAEQWLKEHPLKRKLLLKQSNRISSPLTYGIFHPVILMPKTTDWENTKELQLILTHEYVHICRFDTATKLIMLAALCVHWFNPFVWVMYFLFNRDIELACDESVLRLLGTQSKSDYSLMLIHMEAKKSGLLPLCNSFSKNAIEERITAIMQTKKTTIVSLVLACLIVVGATAAFATSATATDQATSETADFTEYEAFGLKWNDNEKTLFYNGKRVRYFFDGVDLGNGQAIKQEYTDRNLEGEIDVYTVRQRIDNGDGSVDPMGPLTGLATYSQKEFDARVLLPASLSAEAERTVGDVFMRDDTAVPSATVVEETAVTEGTAITEGTGGGTTFADKFSKYAAYGITYVESDSERNVYYNGSLVRNFADITPDGGAFSFTSSKKGGINIKTIYSDGRLCGVEQIKQ